ncbi:hypothetical protein LWI29_020773 [Acer saccharum]|uniref:Uncharacterized protein n=1 Tax=Acer saccharum TaxID=4024 RepID=A0AA39T482_ACESA|nr:hypothetical protein LWI29_020773 [Acer saccharum]
MTKPTSSESSESSRTKYSEHRTITTKVVKSSSFQMTSKIVRISLTDSNATDSDSSSDENEGLCRSLPSSHPIRVKKHINEIKIEDGSRNLTSENGTSNEDSTTRTTIQEASSKSNCRAGGDRCSVKPASRGAPSSKDSEPPAFAEDPQPNSWLGTGRPDDYHFEPGPPELTQGPTTLMPPLGSQARVTELGD